MTAKKCRSCGGELESGFPLDFAYASLIVGRYAKGVAPKGKKMIGLRESKFEEMRKIIAYRCTKCNLLEYYADEEAVTGKQRQSDIVRNVLIALGAIVLIMVVSFIIVNLR